MQPFHLMGDEHKPEPNRADRFTWNNPDDIEIIKYGQSKRAETSDQFIERKRQEWSRDRDRKRPIRMKDIGREGLQYWVREAWTFMVQSNQPQKVFVVERIRHTHRVGKQAMPLGAVVGDVEFRFGYYVVRYVGEARGRWGWGQYSPMIPEDDLKRLLDKARVEGTIPSGVLP